jgi:prepilin-type N-terminal cleavage/methylation domain-containing protein
MTNTTKFYGPSEKGFTLIELSIVLVIIGLIVGGVLVGQDLIKAAEIRATVGQEEKYNAAINTFRTKFNGIPGDLLATQVSAFGICPSPAGVYTCGVGGAGGGDGNGMIEDGAVNQNSPAGEPLLFWQQLSLANLVDGSFGSPITAAYQAAAASTPTLYFPGAKMGRGNMWTVGSTQGLNYYILGSAALSAVGAAGTATYNYTVSITPIEAYNIDIKIDDGAPNTGIVQERGVGASVFASLTPPGGVVNSANSHVVGSSVSGDCTVGPTGTDPTDTYNRSVATGGNTPACMLRLRFN